MPQWTKKAPRIVITTSGAKRETEPDPHAGVPSPRLGAVAEHADQELVILAGATTHASEHRRRPWIADRRPRRIHRVMSTKCCARHCETGD